MESVKGIKDLIDLSVEKVADQTWRNPKYDWIQNGSQFKEQIEAAQKAQEVQEIQESKDVQEFDETQRLYEVNV